MGQQIICYAYPIPVIILASSYRWILWIKIFFTFHEKCNWPNEKHDLINCRWNGCCIYSHLMNVNVNDLEFQQFLSLILIIAAVIIGWKSRALFIQIQSLLGSFNYNVLRFIYKLLIYWCVITWFVY